MDTSTQSIQVRVRERRRFRTVEEKRRMVEEALEPGESSACWSRAVREKSGQKPGTDQIHSRRRR